MVSKKPSDNIIKNLERELKETKNNLLMAKRILAIQGHRLGQADAFLTLVYEQDWAGDKGKSLTDKSRKLLQSIQKYLID